MNERKKILWLVSWYPNKYDQFDGDFIQRHARAAALCDDIHVLFLKQHSSQNTIEEKQTSNNGLIKQIIYLPEKSGALNKLANYTLWKRNFHKAVKKIIKEAKPDLVHVHIPWKAGLIARWVKKKFRIPYVVTEHWGIYNSVVDDNIYTRSFITRYLLKRIYREADAFVSVSKYLGEGVNKTVVKKSYTVVPNVVDTSLFFYEEEKHLRFTFLHVSNMVALKNVEGILQAFYAFLQSGADAELIMIGNRDNYYEELAGKIGIPHTSISFKGEIPHDEVAKEMRRSHAFVLNSNIENSPCVIGEALCCGLPVIATEVGGIPEMITAQNGRLIPSGDSKALYKAMLDLHKNPFYNPSQIASDAKERFSVPVIANQFHLLYRSL